MPDHEGQTLTGCTCRVTGPDFGQTRFDSACPFHGDSGSMVVKVPLSEFRPLVGRMYRHLERRNIRRARGEDRDA